MNRSSEERPGDRYLMEATKENMRREKLFRRWRTENEEGTTTERASRTWNYGEAHPYLAETARKPVSRGWRLFAYLVHELPDAQPILIRNPGVLPVRG